MDWLNDLDPHWSWFVIGLVLAALEMAIPGVFLIWMAGAAIVTGLVSWIVPISLPIQVVLFAVLAIVAVYSGKRWLVSNPVRPLDPKMNDRGAQIVGDMVVVTAIIEGGSGRVKHGDSEWLAKGPDAEPGTRMRVAGHDGTTLLVEHLH